MFSYISAEQPVPQGHPLRALRTMADEALAELSPRFSRLYAKRGRPSIAPEKLLRALLLQLLYTIRSERQLMEQLPRILAIGMRLPTELEWEYAARGGTTAARYGPVDTVAWHDGNSGDSTHQVGTKTPNAFGIYDMLGNVWEWVEDEYDASGKQMRILRGGSFYNPSRDVRVSNRLWALPETAHRDMGFRCVGD
jgi:hypothetical protein